MQGAYKNYIEQHDYDFETRDFSKFLEYQNTRVKNAVSRAGFSLEDYAAWVAEENIDKALSVRKLPDVLKSEKARSVFLKKNITEAEKVLAVENSDQAPKDLDKVPYEILCNELISRLENMAFHEVKALALEPSYSKKRDSLEALSETLQDLLDNIQRLEN